MSKKVVIAGATGLIGKNLCMHLAGLGYEIKALVRNPEKAFDSLKHYNIELVEWDIKMSPDEVSVFLEGWDCVINLAGASVGGKRWNDEVKKELYDSRINSTRQLVNAIQICTDKPKTFITACGVGIYGFRGDENITENSSFGSDFLAKLCIDWEKEAFKAEKNCRVVSMRTGVVLDKNEGALKELMMPFNFFAGGWLGSGRQWFPWIHIRDIIEVYKICIDNDNIRGPINADSPDIVRNKEFCKELGKAMHRPCLFPVPGFALKIIVGEFAETLLNGQKVIPEKLENLNFPFRFKKLNSALEDLLQS
ncbi:MAG: TIGR01777 family oxidoreductase [Ignavibacteria bacterium]|nr:TIGR01777 family oxidoreductase [Ignavibacteria bacterium]